MSMKIKSTYHHGLAFVTENMATPTNFVTTAQTHKIEQIGLVHLHARKNCLATNFFEKKCSYKFSHSHTGSFSACRLPDIFACSDFNVNKSVDCVRIKVDQTFFLILITFVK